MKIHGQHRRTGATAVEYTLMLALIGVVLIAAVSLLAQHFKNAYTRANDAVVAAVDEHDANAAAAAADESDESTSGGNAGGAGGVGGAGN